MNDRTLVKLRCNKEILDIRTVSWTRKSPRSFSILRSELQQLEQRPKNRLISSDCGSFAVLRLTQGPDGVKMLEIRFTWLQEIGAGKVHGWQESIRLPYEPFHVFVEIGEDKPTQFIHKGKVILKWKSPRINARAVPRRRERLRWTKKSQR